MGRSSSLLSEVANYKGWLPKGGLDLLISNAFLDNKIK